MEQFYTPYLSDSGEESDTTGYSSDGSDGTTGTAASPARAENTVGNLLRTPGRRPPVPSGGPDASDFFTSVPAGVGTKFETQESKNTSLYMINSRDRDARLYPQPTFFTLRLPRTFRNVKSIGISQLNLLNSFFNFSSTKGNTYMYVLESGRTILDPTTGSNVDNAVKITIRNGTYSADDLVTELTDALNSTPLFSDITLSKFITDFQATGNYSLLFNTPGQVVYNSLTQTYDRRQTMTDIIGRYFQAVQTVGTVEYSYEECLVAYYYPVIKEMIIETPDPVPFDTLGQEVPVGFTSWYDYIVFAFQGLSDPYITVFAGDAANRTLFDTYRSKRTFNYFLVNKYTCTYNAKQGRLVISAPSLNDSIQTDLNTQYTTYLNELVVENGFTSISEFNNSYNNINNSNGALIDFYNFIQSRFSSNLGVNFGQYSAEFYATNSNEIEIYNTKNRYGWSRTLTPNVSASSVSSNALPAQAPVLWSTIIIPKDFSNAAVSTFVSTIGVPGFPGSVLTFSNAGESQYGYVDVEFNVPPTSYVRTEFKTQYRQNIHIMTLPRYLTNRSESNDLRYPPLGPGTGETPLLFGEDSNGPYIRTDISGNILFNLYNVQQHMFADPIYMRAYERWLTYLTPQILAGVRVQPSSPNFGQRPPKTDITLASYRPFIYFQINADQYAVDSNAHFDVTIHVETQDGTEFPVPILLTWYKDRTAFMADVQQDLSDLGAENPRHYFKQTEYAAGQNVATMDIDVNNLQNTYLMVHVKDTTIIPSAIPLRVFAILSGTYGEYRQRVRTDSFLMPYENLPPLSDQYTPASDVFKDPLKSIYDSTVFQLGYDISGVSNNLLDYIIQAGNSNYYDPNTIDDYITGVSTGLRYQFVVNTGGAAQPAPEISSAWSLYFGTGSSNVIRDTYTSGAANVYLSNGAPLKPLPSGQTNAWLLANWNNPNVAAGGQAEYFYQPDLAYGRISSSSVFLPCINSGASALNTDAVTPAAYTDSSGLTGMSFFLPPSQIVKLDGMTVKFAYLQPSANSAGAPYSRVNAPYPLDGTEYNQAQYRNQTTFVTSARSSSNDWDDWYFRNRRNMKLGVFRSTDISGVDVTTLALSNALVTLSLRKVTQVGNYQDQTGTLRTREPDWGTYYTYTFDTTDSGTVWDLQRYTWDGGATPSASYWYTRTIQPDRAPTYIAGENVYSNYFLTPGQIYNYTYLPRAKGIAPAVGDAATTPLPNTPAWTEDIANSFTAIPFYYDAATSNWTVGEFWGVSFTRQAGLPDPALAGAAPYFGPPGMFGWEVNPATSTLQLKTGEQPAMAPYYWNTKLQFEALDVSYDPATDLTLFGGFSTIVSEYQDTVLFVYKNISSLGQDVQDIEIVDPATSNVQWKWGMESNVNYIAYDDQSGYNYLSYTYSVPVRPTVSSYAIHVRGYAPTSEFTTGVRFIGKSRTDFGRPTLQEIGQEISSLAGYVPISESAPLDASATAILAQNTAILTSGAAPFSHEYADALIRFDRLFSTSATFGKKVGYTGITSTFTGYTQAYASYVGLFSTVRDSFKLYTEILSTATGRLNTYVYDRYGTILPSTIITRNRITDPLPFQFLFKSKLEPPYDTLVDEWGLGWNLGFAKADTFPPRTTLRSDTFIRITQDYIYLRLNQEFNINTMAVSSKEDLSETRDPRGEEGKYFSKILLNSFGGFCRTAVQLPKQFNPVLGKYDVITCQLVDRFGNQIDNADCEYDFVLEITELTNTTKDTATLRGPTSDLVVYQGGGGGAAAGGAGKR
jgi:hypothetical protein